MRRIATPEGNAPEDKAKMLCRAVVLYDKRLIARPAFPRFAREVKPLAWAMV